MKRDRKQISSFLLSVIAALCLAVTYALPAAAQANPTTGPQVISNPVVNTPTNFDVSAPLGETVNEAKPLTSVQPTVSHAPMPTKGNPKASSSPQSSGPLLTPGPLITDNAVIGLSFEGVGNTAYLNCPNVSGFGVAPPDTNAAVGTTQVVEWANTCYAVFNKSTGALIAGPFAGTNFWAGFGAPCENNNDGDPIIQWDKKNHRWVASQNVFNIRSGLQPPYFTCVAISKTADATGGYYRYAFPQPGLPDYPKWGLTPNVYYQTQNDFGNADGYKGVNVCAYQATLMRNGNPNAKQVCILDNSNGTLFDDSMLPADSDTVPAPNGPEVLLGSIDNYLSSSQVYEYVFKVDFDNPANSTLAGVNGSMPISVPTFSLALCTPGGHLSTNCVPQPDITDRLDTLGDRLMYRLAQFDIHGTSHFVVTHTVNFNAPTAVRWYDFVAQGKGSTRLSLYQSGQTPNDGHYRWMGSAAMDKFGDIAIGYSRSSGTAGDYPSIYYSGHTASDPLGMTDTEALIKQGTGAQIDTASRWGDYSSMALDGSNACTFWYAQEYYPATSSFIWATWLASFAFPGCN